MDVAALVDKLARRWYLAFIFALALALLLIPSQLALAAPGNENAVTPEQAHSAALAWLYTHPAFRSSDGSVEFIPAPGMLEIKGKEQQQTVAYVMELWPVGYIVVTPDTRLNPIIAYSSESVFVAADSPQNVLLHLLQGDIPARIWAADNGLTGPIELGKAGSKWENLLDQADDPGKLDRPNASVQATVKYGEYLTSKWDQTDDLHGRATFNYYVPPYAEGTATNYPAGCVATAMSQILNYYEWPNTGIGSHSYTWNNGVDTARVLSADFGAATYDWANALDDYSGGVESPTQRQAAGLVSYHAGVAVDMGYADGGSGAYTSDVANALNSYFRSTGEYVANGGAFYDRLYANMVNGRPGELSIRNTAAVPNFGHAIVIDGVEHQTTPPSATKYWHLNMGWSGYNDGWYDITETPYWATGTITWTQVNGAVLDIVPVPDMEVPSPKTTKPDFTVSWDVSAGQNATKYELQQRYFPATTTSISDDAESGLGNWTPYGYWDQSSYYSHQGTYSFQGDIWENSVWVYPGTLTLNKLLKIDSATTISYYWGARYGPGRELRLEISTDGDTWDTLEVHRVTGDALSWSQETVTTSELAAYVGEMVTLRFVIDYLGGIVSVGGIVGFYVDDIQINNVYTSDGWVTVDNNITSESQAITAAEKGDYSYRVRASYCDPSVQPTCSQIWGNWSDVETIVYAGPCLSKASGNWSAASSWDDCSGHTPEEGDTVRILNGDTITLDSAMPQVTLEVQSGGMVIAPAARDLEGSTVEVTGTFCLGTGGYASNGSFQYQSGGALEFANSSGAYVLADDHAFWPSSNGPEHVIVSGGGGGGLNMNGVSRTVNGTIQTNGPLTNNGNLTVNGTLQINSGGSVDSTPVYGSGSTLRYNSGGTYGRYNEWGATTPHHVHITNNTTLNLPNTGAAAGSVNGNLTIDSGSGLCMDCGNSGQTNPLTVNGNVTVKGALSLGDAVGEDLNVGGNWAFNSGATFNPNGRAVTLNGSSSQSIGGSAATTFAYLILNNSSGVSLGQSQNVLNQITLSNGRLYLGSNNLTLGTGAALSISGADANKMIVTDGAGALCKAFDAAFAAFDYQIGETTGTAEYSPGSLSFGTVSSWGTACMRLADEKHPEFDGDHYLTRYWIVESTGLDFGSCTTSFSYLEADVVGNESGMRGLRYRNSAWMGFGTVDDVNNTISGDIDGFSNFTGGANPTSIGVFSFEAWPEGDGIRIEWKTATELDTLGFNLYRSTGDPEGDLQLLNDSPIRAEMPDSLFGAIYTWTDNTTQPDTDYYYLLEVLTVHDTSSFYGPESAIMSAKVMHRVYLPLVNR